MRLYKKEIRTVSWPTLYCRTTHVGRPIAKASNGFVVYRRYRWSTIEINEMGLFELPVPAVMVSLGAD